MNIVEATKMSLETGKWIKRGREPYTILKPTNSSNCCMIYGFYGHEKLGIMWNPTADDLTADDWTLAKEYPTTNRAYNDYSK